MISDLYKVEEDGWIKLHRKLIKSRVFVNASLLKVFIWCLLKANHEGHWVPIQTGKGETEVFVESGQFIFGRKAAAKTLRMPPSTLYDRIKKLEKLKIIGIQSGTHYSIITIINWGAYQDINKKTGTQTGTHPTTTRQPGGTNNNDKNYNTKKQEPFGLPDRVKEETGKMCDFLYDNKMFLKAHTFANTMRKKKKNEKAILHTLIRCRQKANREPFPDDKAAWAYCMKIIQVEDGNYNEQDHRASHAKETIDPRRQDTYEDEREPTAIGKIIENTINKQKR